MSVPEIPPPPNPPQAGRETAAGCGAAIMILLGLVGALMLLPGICALIFLGGSLVSGGSLGGVQHFVVLGLLTGLVGIVLITVAVRRR